MRTSSVVPLILLPLAAGAAPADFHVVALDAQTGEVRWKSQRDTFAKPIITVHDGVAWVAPEEGEADRVPLDVTSGAPIGDAPQGEGGLTAPVSFVKPQRQDRAGNALRVDPAPSRRILVDGAPAFVEAPVADVQAAGKLGVLQWTPRAGMGTTLIGYDVDQGALRWELDARKHVSAADACGATSLVVNKDAGWLVTEHAVIAFSATDGRVRWTREVPLPLATPDTPCQLALEAADLVVSCRDGLAVIEVESGRLAWSMATGARSSPHPTFHDGLVVFGARRVVATVTAPPRVSVEKPPQYLLLVHDASYLGGYRSEFVRMADTARDRVLWSLASPATSASRLVVLLYEGPPDNRAVRVDVTNALEKQGRALVRLAPGVKKMVLMDGTRQVSSATR